MHIPPKNINDINIFRKEITKNESPIIEIVEIAIEMLQKIRKHFDALSCEEKESKSFLNKYNTGSVAKTLKAPVSKI